MYDLLTLSLPQHIACSACAIANVPRINAAPIRVIFDPPFFGAQYGHLVLAAAYRISSLLPITSSWIPGESCTK